MKSETSAPRFISNSVAAGRLAETKTPPHKSEPTRYDEFQRHRNPGIYFRTFSSNPQNDSTSRSEKSERSNEAFPISFPVLPHEALRPKGSRNDSPSIAKSDTSAAEAFLYVSVPERSAMRRGHAAQAIPGLTIWRKRLWSEWLQARSHCRPVIRNSIRLRP